jgi:protoporphyrinogen oxidase
VIEEEWMVEEANKRTAIVIGAGPAGLTAAYELLTRTDIRPVIIEKLDSFGGISRTIDFKGNKIDIGGHRFFSKYERVISWWQKIIPRVVDLEEGYTRGLDDTCDKDEPPAMLIKKRKASIIKMGKAFDYPVSLSTETLSLLGPIKSIGVVLSYLKSEMFPIKDVRNIEQFFTNRFGKKLYRLFFKRHTEKVWGVKCTEIPVDWAPQRIRPVSLREQLLPKKTPPEREAAPARPGSEFNGELFLYPKCGPGEMWEVVGKEIENLGGTVLMGLEARKLLVKDNRIAAVEAVDVSTGETRVLEGDYFFSTMPIQELVMRIDDETPAEVQKVSDGLVVRDQVMVCMLLDRLLIKEKDPKAPVDNIWLYIHDGDLRMGRLQIFNNWSPWLVKDPANYWLGVEYFCSIGDDIWNQTEEQAIELAISELEKIGFISKSDVTDSLALWFEKMYPANFGTADRVGELQAYLDRFENLFTLGRNGMHRYYNMDQAMLSAMFAVDIICSGSTDKTELWSTSTEKEYIEGKGKGGDS